MLFRSEGVIRGDIKSVDPLHGCWACLVVVREEPFFDILSLIGDAGGYGDRVLHELHGDGASEIHRKIHCR